MPDFERGDVVRAPFPYTGRDTTQHRPALVVSTGGVGASGSLYWVVMITSAENRSWPGDVPVREDRAATGLPAPSVVRPAKIATVDGHRISRLGRLAEGQVAQVMAVVRDTLELPQGA